MSTRQCRKQMGLPFVCNLSVRALQLQAKLFKAFAQHLLPSQKPSGCPVMSLRSIMAIANAPSFDNLVASAKLLLENKSLPL